MGLLNMVSKAILQPEKWERATVIAIKESLPGGRLFEPTISDVKTVLFLLPPLDEEAHAYRITRLIISHLLDNIVKIGCGCDISYTKLKRNKKIVCKVLESNDDLLNALHDVYEILADQICKQTGLKISDTRFNRFCNIVYNADYDQIY